MMNPTRTLLLLAIGLSTLTPAAATEKGPVDGEVRVPLAAYQDLIDRANAALTQPRPAPSRYALGRAEVTVTARDDDGRVTSDVTVNLTVKTFENEWTSVPILPAATALTQATVDGNAVELVAGPEGLSWSTKQAGTYRFQLSYRVDGDRSQSGYVLSVPLPPGAASELNASIPGTGLDIAVVPSVGIRLSESGGRTGVNASVPASSALQISWRSPSREGHVVSRALYRGELRGEAVFVRARFDVELFTAESVTLPLLPRSVTLADLSVDGKQSTVVLDGARYAAILKGRGAHQVELEFEVPVVRPQGPPQVNFEIPEVPVSRFELTLPGDKEVTVKPSSSVSRKVANDRTTAVVNVPMTAAVTLAWTEAIPVVAEERVSANASIYHAAHAEEGVLHVRAMIVYEITRGEASQFDLEVPSSVQLNRVASATGGISDWRVTDEAQGKQTVSIFLDRKVKGEFPFDVEYERLLGAGDASGEPVEVPLLQALNVHRQRGMVALLSGPELALNPVTEDGMSKVGENQLPSFVRDAVTMTIAHTYKYTEPNPSLTVRAVAPERKTGKYDAQVDTLVSIGEVTLKGSATIEVNVKSGSLMQLTLGLPAKINVLGLTGPSLRMHEVKSEADGSQRIDLAFTQEMEGQFRLEVSYERILTDEKEVEVPTVKVDGAEVEHGRIAVEALTTVEVQASRSEQLSPVDVNELPQQLVLKTTNPILLAYKYVHAEPPFRLGLKVTRHKEIQVQDATIDLAHYRTLFTRDGSAITKVTYTVRNSRRQFLKVDLPSGSDPWSVFVAGKVEKPALASGSEATAKEGGAKSVLIKLINSADGFPVEMVYKTSLGKMASLGSLESHLPQLEDMVVTNTRWDIYLPVGLRYKDLETNMDVLTEGEFVDEGTMQKTVAQHSDNQVVQPLHIAVPTRGIHFQFEKLYANQSDEAARFSLAFASVEGERAASFASLAATLLVWLGIAAAVVRPAVRLPALLATALGVVVVLATTAWFGTRLGPVLALSAALAVALVVIGFLARRRAASSAIPPGAGGAA